MKYIKFRAKAVHPEWKGLYIDGYGICYQYNSCWLFHKEMWIEVSRKTVEIIETKKWNE